MKTTGLLESQPAWGAVGPDASHTRPGSHGHRTPAPRGLTQAPVLSFRPGLPAQVSAPSSSSQQPPLLRPEDLLGIRPTRPLPGGEDPAPHSQTEGAPAPSGTLCLSRSDSQAPCPHSSHFHRAPPPSRGCETRPLLWSALGYPLGTPLWSLTFSCFPRASSRSFSTSLLSAITPRASPSRCHFQPLKCTLPSLVDLKVTWLHGSRQLQPLGAFRNVQGTRLSPHSSDTSRRGRQ